MGNMAAVRDAIARSSAIVPGWRWKPHASAPVAPPEMVTRHLFHALRMIWNETPGFPPIGRPPRRHFGAAHPPRYLAQAVTHLGLELLSRPDLTPEMEGMLKRMAEHLAGDWTEEERLALAGAEDGIVGHGGRR